MKILGLSFDDDGCLYHRGYLLAVASMDVSNLPYTEKNSLYTAILIEENINMLTSMQKLCSEYDRSFTYVGSLGQYHRTNFEAPAKKITITSHDEARLKGINTRYGLQENTLQTIESGTLVSFPDSFSNTIQTVSDFVHSELDPLLMQDHAISYANEGKMNVLYGQMHRLACTFPEDELTFKFFTNRLDVLASLNRFFIQDFRWIPENLTLHLCHYEGDKVNTIAMLRGEGNSDHHYKETLRYMDAITDCFLPEKAGANPSTLNAQQHITRSKLKALQLLSTQQNKKTKKHMPTDLVHFQLLRHAIVYDGNLNEVRILLKNSPSLLNQIDKDGVTILHLASANGRLEIADYLKNQFTDLDIDALTPAATSEYKSLRYPPNMTAADLGSFKHGNDLIADLTLHSRTLRASNSISNKGSVKEDSSRGAEKQPSVNERIENRTYLRIEVADLDIDAVTPALTPVPTPVPTPVLTPALTPATTSEYKGSPCAPNMTAAELPLSKYGDDLPEYGNDLIADLTLKAREKRAANLLNSKELVIENSPREKEKQYCLAFKFSPVNSPLTVSSSANNSMSKTSAPTVNKTALSSFNNGTFHGTRSTRFAYRGNASPNDSVKPK